MSITNKHNFFDYQNYDNNLKSKSHLHANVLFKITPTWANF
ncbi:hypothetical protein [Azospirillum palustre]